MILCFFRFLRSNALKTRYKDIYRPSTGAVMLLAALHTCDQVKFIIIVLHVTISQLFALYGTRLHLSDSVSFSSSWPCACTHVYVLIAKHPNITVSVPTV